MFHIDSKHYINRELSWLQFNSRVLNESANLAHPLLERFKYLAIYGTNLDEFYMIRVAGLQDIDSVGIITSTIDGISAKDLLKEISEYLHKEKEKLENQYNSLVSSMNKEKVEIKEYFDLNSEHKKMADDFFASTIYPVIIPIAVDSTHPFPHFNNLSFGLVVKLIDNVNQEINYAMIRIPRVLPRFYQINNIYIPIESIIKEHTDKMFIGYEMIESASFRVTRNADIVIEEEEADDFIEIMEEGLKSRRRGSIVRLEIGNCSDDNLVDFLTSHMSVDKSNIYYHNIPLNLGSFWQIVVNPNFSHLMYKPYKPKVVAPFSVNQTVMDTMEKQDVCLQLPYESFDPVIQLVKEATADPDVLAIKMTLYRAGSNSPIIKSLIEAAQEGKQVTAMVELKARFDEENNLKWAKALEASGAHVIYGVVGLKIHAKIILIVKKTDSGIKRYVHLATGNYNPTTAKIYCDMSFFTTNPIICDDATHFFHYITGYAKNAALDKLSMSPNQMKMNLLTMIAKESEYKKNGYILAKVNSLVDREIISSLYAASNEGVKIDLIVRGICCLRPGIEGVSKNIRVISIVGKYLEHIRAFHFKHSNPKLYFSSADWMPRNLDKRIELMTPIIDENITKDVLKYLNMQLMDNMQSSELQSDGSYKKIKNRKKPFDSQKEMEKIFIKKANEEKKSRLSGESGIKVLKGR